MARDLHTQRRAPQTAAEAGSSGSQTILQTEHNEPATLHLRGTQQAEQRHIQWSEDVIDNEGMGKKSSKVCCIYHKPHEPGDSDSDDSTSSDSDDEPDLSRAQRGKRSGRKPKASDDKDKSKERKPSPNAYERQPKHKQVQKG